MYNKLTEMVTTGIDIKAKVLINRVDNRTKEAREAFKIVEKSLNLPPLPDHNQPVGGLQQSTGHELPRG